MDEQLLKMASQQADFCQIFGSSTRILILWVLAGREMRVGDIAEAIDASLQNTSQHLRLMRDRGILTSRRKGHAIYYRIDGHELMHDCPVLCRLEKLHPKTSLKHLDMVANGWLGEVHLTGRFRKTQALCCMYEHLQL